MNARAPLLLSIALGTAVACAAADTPSGLHVADGFQLELLAHVSGARELAVLPDGDLLVGTSGLIVALVPLAHGSGQAPHTFVSIADPPVSGVAFSASQHTIFVAGGHGVYRIAYRDGDQRAAAAPQRIASVRTGPVAPNSDGDDHSTTSVAFSDRASLLFVSVGSSCNACVEVDPTRAEIERMTATGNAVTKRAARVRNAIALTIDPLDDHLWAGDAGQDDLSAGHPYEFLDDVSSHAGVADYGWPQCEEHHVAYVHGAQCAATVVPLVVFPAYTTPVGAVFYPLHPSGTHAFPASYRGGIFVTRHGSWHRLNGCTVAPEVDFVPMDGARPKTPVDWADPTRQWRTFVSGYQPGCASSTRLGRPTGIAVAPDGSLLIADDDAGAIYRIEP